MLFEQQDVETTSWAKGAASYLERHIRGAGLLYSKPVIDKWAVEFDLLQRVETRIAIRRVLKWYCKNLRGKYTPQAYSAVSFRTKFQRIKSASRQGDIGQRMCPEALAIYEGLGLIWPGEGCPKHQVLQLIHETYVGYSAFYNGMVECRGTADKRGVRLLTYLIETLPPASSFTREWVADVHNYACTNFEKGWHGLNDGFTWRLHHWRFTEFGERLCRGYTIEPNRWEWVIKQVGGNDEQYES